jgi:hypothetical protein
VYKVIVNVGFVVDKMAPGQVFSKYFGFPCKQRPIKMGGRTVYCHLRGHLFKLALTDDPTCERCLEKIKSATHILFDCEAVAYLRFFHHLGRFFMEPSEYDDVPTNKVLHFIHRVGLIRGQPKKGKHNRSLKVAVQGLDYYGPYGPPVMHSFIHFP